MLVRTLSIRELRMQKGLTQAELAKQLKVNVKTIGRWEVDVTLLGGRNLIKVCNFFKVSPNELLGYRID